MLILTSPGLGAMRAIADRESFLHWQVRASRTVRASCTGRCRFRECGKGGRTRVRVVDSTR